MTSAFVEKSSVQFGTRTIDYAIARSARRTTVSIAVNPSVGVVVTAPEPAPVSRLDRIVWKKAPWIIERVRRQSDLPAPPSAREFVTGETFRYLGRQYRLRLDFVEASSRPLRLEGGFLRVPIPRRLTEEHRIDFVRAALVDWYMRCARTRLPEGVRAWAERLRFQAPPVRVGELRKRWGSASLSKGIHVNWRVIQASASLVDYVLVHELMHLRHPDHTREFWAALGRVMPDYELRKMRLRELGRSLIW